MRLIDADELKTHKFLTPQVKVIGGRHNGKVKEQIVEAYQKGWNDAIDAIIDNAPTVEIPVARWDAYCEGQKVGYEKGIEERPQGEWVLLESCDELCLYKCSNCGHQILSLPSYLHTYKGCFCGADMRGGRY